MGMTGSLSGGGNRKDGFPLRYFYFCCAKNNLRKFGNLLLTMEIPGDIIMVKRFTTEWKMKKRIRIQDVAREAGVSVTTASYVLNHKENARIGADTAARVLETAKRFSYVPNLSARTLASRQSKLIGVIIPMIGPGWQVMFSNPFYGDFLSAAECTARANGYHLLISGTAAGQNYSSVVRTRELDGVIIVGAFPGDSIEEIKATGIPIVLVDCYIDDPYFHRIGIDDRKCGYLATQYLLDKGHRRIALVCGSPGGGVMEKRFLGYQDALREAGIPYNQRLLYEGAVDYAFGEQTAAELLRRGNGETAAFVASDISALGLLNGMREQGKNVPEDLSIIGFDDVSLSWMCVPKLTTVHQNIFEKGELAAQTIVDAIGGAERRDIILDAHIVERASVKNRT